MAVPAAQRRFQTARSPLHCAPCCLVPLSPYAHAWRRALNPPPLSYSTWKSKGVKAVPSRSQSARVCERHVQSIPETFLYFAILERSGLSSKVKRAPPIFPRTGRPLQLNKNSKRIWKLKGLERGRIEQCKGRQEGSRVWEGTDGYQHTSPAATKNWQRKFIILMTENTSQIIILFKY